MEDLDLYGRVGLALAIGLMVGIERGWHSRAESEGQRVAGIRTFALIGLLGGIVGALSVRPRRPIRRPRLRRRTWRSSSSPISAGCSVATDIGMTTQVAAIATFALGLLAVRGDMAIAAASGVAMTALLASKTMLHRWIERIDRLELRAGIQLLVISVVLLPVLPNRGFGPGEAINPYALWWIVVLLAGLSFLGYVAVRVVGARPRHPVDRASRRHGVVDRRSLCISRVSPGAMRPWRRRSRPEPCVASAMMSVRILHGRRDPELAPAADARLADGVHDRGGGNACACYCAAGSPAAGRRRRSAAARQSAGARSRARLRASSWAASWSPASSCADWLGDGGLYALAAVAGLSDVDAITVLMTPDEPQGDFRSRSRRR